MYAYARNAPGELVDPTGEFGIGGAIGGALTNAGAQMFFYKKYGRDGRGLSYPEALRCVNLTSVAISGAIGFAGASLADVLLRGVSIGRYGASVATGTAIKLPANISTGGPMSINRLSGGNNCDCRVPPHLRAIVEAFQ